MKAISLHQPWASLMAIGAKTIETRSWGTSYRGDLAICSTRKPWTPRPGDRDLVAAASEAFRRAGVPYHNGDFHLLGGAVLAIVTLRDVLHLLPNMRDATPFPDDPAQADRELIFGDFTYGRFAWVTTNLRPLARQIPVVGHQGLFNLPWDVESQVRAQLGPLSPSAPSASPRENSSGFNGQGGPYGPDVSP